MAHEERHPREELQDALDRRLDPARLAEVESHLAGCEPCRRELEALRWTKERTRSAIALELPTDLEARLSRALDEEDRASGTRAPRSRLRAIAPFLAAAAAVAAIWVFGHFWTGAIPAAIAGELRDYRSGALPLEIRSAEVAALEAYFAEKRLPFPMKVYDLAMMAYPLEGAAVRPVGGSAGALVAYRGPDGRILLCRMYEGRFAGLPAPSERRTNDGITFQVYRDSELTLVFWEEGAVMCVLAGEGDPEAVLGLAFAKAVRT